MRFGIGMNGDHTLEEVGQQFSLTRERIRQIEAKAIRKLKHPSRSSVLRSFSTIEMAEYGPVNDLTSSSWPTTDLFSFGLRPDAAQYRPRHQIGIRFSSGARLKSSISRSNARVGNLERPDRQTQEVGFELKTRLDFGTRAWYTRQNRVGRSH